MKNCIGAIFTLVLNMEQQKSKISTGKNCICTKIKKAVTDKEEGNKKIVYFVFFCLIVRKNETKQEKYETREIGKYDVIY